MNEPFWERNVILKVVAGESAYGLDVPKQTPKVRAACIPPHHYVADQNGREQWEHWNEQGHVLTLALSRFIRLALACEPTVIELLYTWPEYILFVNE